MHITTERPQKQGNAVMSSITGMGFSTYTNLQTQRANTDQNQPRMTTNTTFGEAFNKAISASHPSEQKQHDHSVEVQNANQAPRKPVPNTRDVIINGERHQEVIIEGKVFFDVNGVEHDLRAVFMVHPPWFTQYILYTDTDKLAYRSDTYPKLQDLPATERYHLGKTLWEILDNTLDEFGIERGTMEFVNAVFEDEQSSHQIHMKFWENILLDERMKKYVRDYYV